MTIGLSDSGAMISLGAAVLGVTGATVGAYAMFAPRSELFGPVVSRAPAGMNATALTFDDGPWPGSTEAILDILERERVRATFFVIGRYAAERRELLRRIHEEGHLIGNHTFDHSRLGLFKGREYWRRQVGRTSDLLGELTGSAPTYFRPPMGFKLPPVMDAAARSGCRVVTWTRRAFDGVGASPHAIVRNLSRARAGEILLLHDGRDPASRRSVRATPDALPRVIATLRASGLGMVRLDELLGESPDHSPSRP